MSSNTTIDIQGMALADKIELIKQLRDDEDFLLLIEIEVQERVARALNKLKKQIDDYLVEFDKARAEQKRNMWSTSAEAMEAEGGAKVLARVEKIVDEIVMTPELSEVNNNYIEQLQQLKNKIVNNSLSNRVHGTRACETLRRYEAALADILETGMVSAYLTGVRHSHFISEETRAKLEEQEKNHAHKLSMGVFDDKRITKEAIEWINTEKAIESLPEEKRERARAAINQARLYQDLIPLNPDAHPDVIEFLKKL